MSKSSVEAYFKPQTGGLFLVHMRPSSKFPIGNKKLPMKLMLKTTRNLAIPLTFTGGLNNN